MRCKKEYKKDFYVLVKLWQITEDQFVEIQEQEGKLWCNKVLFLGETGGLKIKTITGCWEDNI